MPIDIHSFVRLTELLKPSFQYIPTNGQHFNLIQIEHIIINSLMPQSTLEKLSSSEFFEAAPNI